MLTVWHFIVHWLGFDYGLPYGHFGSYDAYSGLLGLSVMGGLAEIVRRITRRRHDERMAQAARHQTESLELAKKNHADLKDHLTGVLRKQEVSGHR